MFNANMNGGELRMSVALLLSKAGIPQKGLLIKNSNTNGDSVRCFCPDI